MPTLRLDADAKKGVKAFQDLEKAIDQAEKSLDETTRSAKQLDAAARRISENANPQERYNRKMKELADLVARGKVSIEDARVQAAKYGSQLDKVSDSGRAAFNPAMLFEFAKGFAAPTAAATAMLQILKDARAEQQAIAQAQLTESQTRGALVQLAGGDAAKRQRLFAAADKTFGEGFVQDRNAANQLTFELDSAGRLGDRAFFSRLALIDDAAVLAKSSGLISSGFEGGDAVGSSQAIVSKAIAGALPATGVSPAQIAEGVALASGMAKSFGLSDEETFASVSRIAQVTGSGREAGNRLRSMLSSLSRQGVADQLKGQGIGAIVGSVSSQGFSEEQLTKYLGSSEAAQAYAVLSDSGALQKRIGEIADAQANNLANQTILNAIQDRNLGAGVFRRRGIAGRVLVQEEDAIAQNLGEADRDFAFQFDRQRFGAERAYMNDKVRGALSVFGPSDGEYALQMLVDETRQTNDILRSQSGATTRQE